MKIKILSFSIYTFSIVLLTILSVNIGAELIQQYSMYANGYSADERHLLADDMGFGILLMLGLIPELLVGVTCGYFLGKTINAKVKIT